MSFNSDSLLDLLPAIYRLRDEEAAARMEGLLSPAEAAERDTLAALPSPTALEQQRLLELRAKASRGPLASLLAVFAPELEAMEDSLSQLYDDLFIETCADWMIPYLGDLIGYEPLHPLGDSPARARAEVARTIALRRRKGTAPVLEQLALDVTGWPARVVESFERLQTTQHLNHRRPGALSSPDLRRGEALGWLRTPFETACRTVEVRSIARRAGRHNIANVGVHLWRIGAERRTRTTATRVAEGRYRISPLGQDTPLVQYPEPETTISHLAEPRNLPLPLGRRSLKQQLDRLSAGGGSADPRADPNWSPRIWVNGQPWDLQNIRVCHLGDQGGGWGHTPPAGDWLALDPLLGRLALPASVSDSDAAPALVEVSWFEGFTALADLGGGAYNRPPAEGDRRADLPRVQVPHALDPAIRAKATVEEALQLLNGHGVVEITDNATHRFDSLVLRAGPGQTLLLRAANRCRPVLRLRELVLEGEPRSAIGLDGLLIQGGPVLVPEGLSQPGADGSSDNGLRELTVRHCTLVPGWGLRPDGAPTDPEAVSLRITAKTVERIELERSICGALRAPRDTRLRARTCLIDATDPSGVALMADEGAGGGAPQPGPLLSLEGCTVVGRLLCFAVGEISNSVLLADSGPGWTAPVRAERRQVGCVRFSWIPPGSLLPAPYHCQPADPKARLPARPVFSSLRYGHPAYGRLSDRTPEAIRRGGEDSNEMGVFHHLWLPQRESNLRLRLAEYLRVGLTAGIVYES